MNANTATPEEKKLAEEIMVLTVRNIAKDYDFIQKPVYSLKLKADDKVKSISSDYSNLYFEPKWVISLYKKNKKKFVETVVHSVLHCLFLHPSQLTEQNELFDAAADAAVFCMMNSAEALVSPSSCRSLIDKLNKNCSGLSAAEIYAAAKKEPSIKSAIYSLSSLLKEDDHSAWYRKEDRGQKKDDGISIDENTPVISEEELQKAIEEGRIVPVSEEDAKADKEKEWSAMLVESKSNAQRSAQYGNVHGKMFAEIKKPDRFSRMSYKEYIRRFARTEIAAEDPDTLDHVLYNWGIENLDDTPLVEYCETKEHFVATDIIIAVDMSGSCSGEIAVNFLRQLHTLFAEMNIKGVVNINVVTFDTEITSSFVIHSAKDAKRLLEKYEGRGWGGTDFHCVFDYADKFSKKNRGKKLRGLFFFSDAMGSFPDKKPKYKTTFFVPVDKNSRSGFGYIDDFSFVPNWVDLVKYDDN